MIKEYKIENISFSLANEGNDIRLKTVENSILFFNQNIESILQIIKINFKIVNDYYNLKINSVNEKFELSDINLMSFNIVLHYLYMYNMWRKTYRKQENRDLKFSINDLEHATTHDIIFNYYKTNYPFDWEAKCAVLVGLSLVDLKEYYKKRKDFYNK